MIPLLEPVSASLATANMLQPLVLSDLSDEQARRRPRDGDGPSIAWEVGHLLDFRRLLLDALASRRATRSPRTSSGRTQAMDRITPTVADLRQAWGELQTEIATALGAAPKESVRQMIEADGQHGEQSALDSIVFLAWHEAYPLGAIGIIRKSLGLPGPTELVMSQSAP